MVFEHQLKALVFFHLEEHSSANHLIQVLKEDDFVRNFVAPHGGIEKSNFSEVNNERGLEQFLYVFQELYRQVNNTLPKEYEELGDRVAIDGSLIDAILSICWADYRFVSQTLEQGQTDIMDRYYQHHKDFDLWQNEGKYFVCRIRANTKKVCLKVNEVKPDSFLFNDAVVLLGTPYVNQTVKEVRLIGFTLPLTAKNLRWQQTVMSSLPSRLHLYTNCAGI